MLGQNKVEQSSQQGRSLLLWAQEAAAACMPLPLHAATVAASLRSWRVTLRMVTNSSAAAAGQDWAGSGFREAESKASRWHS